MARLSSCWKIGPCRVTQMRSSSGCRPFDVDDFAFLTGLLHFAREHIPAGTQIHLLEYRLLHVETEIGHAPRDTVVMPGR